MNNINFEIDSDKVKVRFKEFKLGDKIGYYIDSEDIRYYTEFSKAAIDKIIKQIKRENGQPYVIRYDNKYYISQFGLEILIMRAKKNRNNALQLILSKIRNKNYNNSNKIYRPKEKGVKPIVSDEIIFRVRDNKVYISTKSISNKLNINHTELFNKCDREYLFNKDNLFPLTINKRRKTTSYVINEQLYNKLINIDNKEIRELYRKI
jgi:hypothetical protein